VRDIELTPGYSTREIPGKCLKCLADQEYTECLRALLGGDTDNQDMRRTYEALVSFLQSPDMKRLRDESEQLLSDGRKVTVSIRFEDGKPRYELKIDG
jgi:hypothetical protein